MFRFVFAIVLLCVMGVASAQETARFRLRVPSAEEYLAALPEIFSDPLREPDDLQWAFTQAKKGVMEEFRSRYTAELVNSNIAIDAFEALRLSAGFFYDYDVIGQAIARSLMAERMLTLDDEISTQVDYRNFHANAIPRDFSGDGQKEWMLRLTYTEEFWKYDQLFVIDRDDEGVRFIDTPLPWFGGCFGYQCFSLMEEQRFEDMTGDNVPEWVLAIGGAGGGGMNHGWLIILQWIDGTLVDVTPSRETDENSMRMFYSAAASSGGLLFPYGIEIAYADTDKNGTTEVVITQTYYDNWDCEFTEERTFEWQVYDWEASFRPRFPYERNYSDTAGCAMRKAYWEMANRDYAEAIPLFEHALALFKEFKLSERARSDEYWMAIELARKTELEAFATLRLVLAYALTDDLASASTLLDALMPVDASAPIPALIAAAKSVDLDTDGAAGLCAAVYSVFYDYYMGDAFQDTSETPNTYWGVVYDIPLPLHNNAPNPDPSRSGCDLAAVAQDKFALIPTPTPYPMSSSQVSTQPYPTLTPDPEFVLLQQGEALYAEAQAAESEGDKESALAAYVEIITLAPESPWGKLAALHLEPVE